MLTPVDSVKNRTVQAARSASTLPVVAADPNRIAVLLNRNARKVNDKMARKMERIVGSEHFYYSHTLEEAEAFSRELVQQGYGTIVCGGGDGTLANMVNMIRHYVQEANAWRSERFTRYGEQQNLLSVPRFAFLRLGTGNGITGVVGAADPVEDLKRIVDYAPGRTHEISLVESDGGLFFFGGMGYDSLILNDYNILKERTHNPLMAPIMHSVLGYFAAIFARTLPRAILHNRATKIEGQVINHGKAYYIDPRRGDAAIAVEPGTTLFEGLATMVSVGTAPYFGYGLKVFPFANMMPGMMHLRIATLGPMGALTHMPSIWRGSYRNPTHVHDFLVEKVSVDLARPFPFQHSGDAQGLRDHVEFKVADAPLGLVDYYPPRLTS